MSPMKQNSNYDSNHYGEAVVRQANVLASCYIVDTTGALKGLHYCTTGVTGLPSPPSSPPLAAITSSNELALLPKAKKPNHQQRRGEFPGKRIARRGGAALVIREECERFFCERMSAVFRGERSTGPDASGLSGAYAIQTPPSDNDSVIHVQQQQQQQQRHGAAPIHDSDEWASVSAWLEIWDFAGGASFRAFAADDGQQKSLFVFFDGNVVGIDLKKALMALIELADTPLDCRDLIVCVDRRIPDRDVKGLMKSLQWVGFELTTLDHWAHDLDVTSRDWLFMGMEL